MLLVVVLPTALLSWGGFQLARQQTIQFETRVKDLMGEQLAEVDSRIKKYFETQEALLQKTTSRPFSSIDSIRETSDSVGIIDNMFIITANDILSYPNPLSPLNERELEFHSRIKTIVDDGEIQNQVRQKTAANASNNAGTVVDQSNDSMDELGKNAEANQPADVQKESSQQEQSEDPNSPALPDSKGPNSQNNENDNAQKPTLDKLFQLVSIQVQRSEPQQSLSRRASPQQEASPQNLQQGGNQFPQLDFSSLNGINAKEETFEVCEGWFIWYWGRGVNLIFWQRIANGNIVCVALERSRWMSDLIAELPDTIRIPDTFSIPGESKRSKPRSTRIVNSNGETVYQWGSSVSDEMVMAAETPVSHPLTSWKLQMWVTPEELKSQSLVGLNIFLGILASSIALVAVAWIFHREYTKDLQEASKRVSFVNQVSHELRTPLTNIRMYAELLRQQLDQMDGPEAEQAKKRIDVVESESNRLSRLIGNVLTFAGRQKDKLEIRRVNGVIDDCIRDVLSSFAPNLEKLKIGIEKDLDCANEVRFDPDAVGQMVGNLISNVEKYASDGETIEIKSKMDGEFAEISIQDGGPGVDPRHADRIFEPFWRLSNELQHASGTGIGLSISRELARMHGGDLTLRQTGKGACFVVRIKTQKAN